MMFPHTVTIYNTETGIDPDTLEDVTVNHITVLRGVCLQASKAANVRTTGLVGADAANLYIPFDVCAADGVTGDHKKYIGPVEFWRLDDKTGFWTISDGGNTFFVKGEVVEPDKDRQYIEMAYDNVFSVTKVDDMDYGELKHWEVGGN